jgi:hypothetical protein
VDRREEELDMTGCVRGSALAFAMAMSVVAGCAKDSGTIGDPQLAVCLGSAGQQCLYYSPGQPITTVIKAPTASGEPGSYDVFLDNLGEEDTQVLNVYLASGSNRYVSLLWQQADPSGEGKFTSSDPVAACSPDRTLVSDPELLPDALGISSPCVFPLDLPGINPDTNVGGRLGLRLRYDFSPEDEVDTNPATVIIQYAYKEDDLAPEGVLRIDIPVEACAGRLQVSPPAIEFTASPPNFQTQDICLGNLGCGPLEVQNIAFANPVSGDVFTFQSLPPEGTVILPPSDASYAPVCFKVKFQPTDASAVSNIVRITSNDPTSPQADVVLTTGDCPFSYELSHTDLVESEKSYLDFAGVVSPDTAEKVITLRNTGDCPVTLQETRFDNPVNDLKTGGGPFYVEIRKQGETVGFLGVPGGPGVVLNPKVVLQQKDQALDLVVHFEPEENKTYEPTNIRLVLRTGGGANFEESILIQAGEPQADLVLAPSQGETQAFFAFETVQGQPKSSVLALHNRGLAPIQVTGLTLRNQFNQPLQDYKLADNGSTVVDGAFVPTEVPPLGVVPVEIVFDPSSNIFDTRGFIDVWTEDYPEGGEAPTPYTVTLQGYAYTEGELPELPQASFGAGASFDGVKVGSTVNFNAGESTGGSSTILEQSYTWWLGEKPADSVAYLNERGKPSASLKVDKPGTYRVYLTVFGETNSGAVQYLYSDAAEAVITVVE